MSVPYSIIYCDACDERWSSLCLVGIFRYRLADGVEFPADCELGWCDQCSGIQPIEKIPLIDEVRLRPPPLPLLAQGLPPAGLIGRIRLALSGRKRRKMHDTRTANAGPEQWLKLLEARTDPPKCMMCGCPKVLPIRPPFVTEAKSYDFLTDNTHPRCGGRLRVRDSGGLWVAPVPIHRTYDCNGSLLEPRSADL